MLVAPSDSGMNQNQPCCEPEDRDVAFELARQPFGALEVAVDRGAVVLAVADLRAELVREERVAARGVDDDARVVAHRRPVALRRDDAAAAVAAQRDVAHAAALDDVGAAAGRVADQHVIEVGAAHLVRHRHVLAPRVAELEQRAVLVPRRDELDAPLRHAERRDLVGDAERVEQRHVRRKQRLADVEARVTRLLEQRDPVAARREQRRGGRPGRAAADDQDVGRDRRRHGRRGTLDRGGLVSFLHRRIIASGPRPSLREQASCRIFAAGGRKWHRGRLATMRATPEPP